jgi:hypothetical protein
VGDGGEHNDLVGGADNVTYSEPFGASNNSNGDSGDGEGDSNGDSDGDASDASLMSVSLSDRSNGDSDGDGNRSDGDSDGVAGPCFSLCGSREAVLIDSTENGTDTCYCDAGCQLNGDCCPGFLIACPALKVPCQQTHLVIPET